MAIVITKQPTDVAVNQGDTISFSLEATGDSLTYDWEYKSATSNFYRLAAASNPDAWTYNQPTLTFYGSENRLVYSFRCKITDASGASVYSDTVRIINLAEAGAGFILPETMHSLAEVIRAKTETTDKILPADMAAMIEGIETGSFNAMSGSATPSSATTTLNLGTSIPASDNYLLVCLAPIFSAKGKYYLRKIIVQCIDGSITGSTTTTSASSAANGYEAIVYASNASITTGTLNNDSIFISDDCYFYSGKKYEWWYAYE